MSAAKGRILWAGLAALVLHLVLIQPNHPEAVAWDALFVFSLELPVLLLLLIALRPGPILQAVRVMLCVVLTAICVLKTADFVSFTALSRGFNPAADLPLVDAFARLLLGTLGPWLTLGAAVLSVLAVAALAALLWWATGVWGRVTVPRAWARLSAVGAGLAAMVAVAEIGHAMRQWTLPVKPIGAAFTARVGLERVQMVRRTLAEMRIFRAEVAQDPFVGQTGLLAGLDRDVLIIFVESYGRTSIDTPFYADLHRATLAEQADLLTGMGLSLRSGYLASPTHGGQSWLAHATVANGLWIDSQIRYGAALSSGRATLFHLAAQEGFRTAAVMPQITLDWPESERMGFEEILVAADLGYGGLPFNWVTMPDQFTLTALDRLLRTDDDPRSLFAQVALASSHAPWTPVPPLLPWDEIDDGTVYNTIATSGVPPEVLWRDREQVRAQYRLAVDYALRTVLSYAGRHAQDPPLLLVIGDHQAAEFIGLDARPDVPIHVIGPADLVAALAPVAPSPGLIPEADAPVLPMDRLRAALLTVFREVEPE